MGEVKDFKNDLKQIISNIKRKTNTIINNNLIINKQYYIIIIYRSS
jgi:hypothetical protein